MPYVTVQKCPVQNNSATGVQFYGSNPIYKNSTSSNNYCRLGKDRDRLPQRCLTGMLVKSMATNVTIGTNLVK